MGKRKFSKKDIEDMIISYKNGGNISRVAKEFGCSSSYILKIMKNNNVPIIPQTQTQRKRLINENFFNIIDTEEKAY